MRMGVCGRPCRLAVRNTYTGGYLLAVAGDYVRTLCRWLCVLLPYGRVSFASAARGRALLPMVMLKPRDVLGVVGVFCFVRLGARR